MYWLNEVMAKLYFRERYLNRSILLKPNNHLLTSMTLLQIANKSNYGFWLTKSSVGILDCARKWVIDLLHLLCFFSQKRIFALLLWFLQLHPSQGFGWISWLVFTWNFQFYLWLDYLIGMPSFNYSLYHEESSEIIEKHDRRRGTLT